MSGALPNNRVGETKPGSVATDGRQSRAYGRPVRLWRLVTRRPLAVICMGYLLLLAAAAVLAPLVVPYDPTNVDLDAVMSGPTSDHVLGTDHLGRDILSRLMYGGRISMINASVAAITFVLVGTSTGLMAGALGGWADRIFTWGVDVVIAIPGLLVLLLILTIFGSNMIIAMIALGILTSPGFARVVRSVTLGIREELSIAAARVSGLPTRHIVARHMLPRVTGPILVYTSLFCGGALIIEAGLAYLGFGPPPPTPTWGGMIAEASAVIQQHTWFMVPPGVTLALATLAFALLGDVIRDVAAERTGRVPVRRQGRRAFKPAIPAPTKSDARPARASLLSIRGVSITVSNPHGPAAVVENVDLDIEPGEMVGMVGESGCGKSITGKAILGLLPVGARVTRGSIRIGDREFAGASRREFRPMRGSDVAMISQEPQASLDPMYTVKQQVGELVRRHHGGSRRDAYPRVLKLLRDVALPEPELVARRYPHELSGGMAQRVAIAMALAGEPKLLIADEPTTALDVTVQAEILDLLRELQAIRKMAVLLISHDWGVIAQNCRRAYVMYAGQVVEAASISQMLERPSHPYTLGLLRSMPRHAEPGSVLTAIPGNVPTPGEWPFGCHFAPRCPIAVPECSQKPIPLIEFAPDRHSRCIKIADLHEDRSYARTATDN